MICHLLAKLVKWHVNKIEMWINVERKETWKSPERNTLALPNCCNSSLFRKHAEEVSQYRIIIWERDLHWVIFMWVKVVGQLWWYWVYWTQQLTRQFCQLQIWKNNFCVPTFFIKKTLKKRIQHSKYCQSEVITIFHLSGNFRILSIRKKSHLYPIQSLSLSAMSSKDPNQWLTKSFYIHQKSHESVRARSGKYCGHGNITHFSILGNFWPLNSCGTERCGIAKLSCQAFKFMLFFTQRATQKALFVVNNYSHQWMVLPDFGSTQYTSHFLNWPGCFLSSTLKSSL